MFLIFMLLLIVTLTLLQKKGSAPGTGTRDYTLWRKVEENIIFEPHYSRELLPDMKTEKFFRVNFREVLILKLGQRKLFFNELEFYTLIKERTDADLTIIYAGSAPGIHSTLLAKLFPSWDFHYYDANPFCSELYEHKNIFLYNQFFTDKDAEYWNKKKEGNKNYLVFVSDVRTIDEDLSVEQDMIMQRNWVEIIKSDACMLKFRLRWIPPMKQEYFDGRIYFQPRISFSSTETRLIFFPQSDGSYAKKIYDTETYNNQIFYYQRHHRNAFHEYSLNESNEELSDSFDKLSNSFDMLSKEIKGLCHCHDCWSEIEICRKFLGPNCKIGDITALMNRISKHTRSTLDTPPHNLLVNERDINKKIKMLENLAFKNVENIIKKRNEQQKPRVIF
jgi:hypothetical protein